MYIYIYIYYYIYIIHYYQQLVYAHIHIHLKSKYIHTHTHMRSYIHTPTHPHTHPPTYTHSHIPTHPHIHTYPLHSCIHKHTPASIRYRIRPLGNHSHMENLTEPKSKVMPLYSTGGFKFLWDTKLYTAQVVVIHSQLSIAYTSREPRKVSEISPFLCIRVIRYNTKLTMPMCLRYGGF